MLNDSELLCQQLLSHACEGLQTGDFSFEVLQRKKLVSYMISVCFNC